jgi:hypothetical protein
MPGAREKIIVYITHFLVVERSYSYIHLCLAKSLGMELQAIVAKAKVM